MKTYSAKPSEITRNWYIVDATGQPLGRLATQVAKYLTGKHKPTYTSHIDTGDHIVIINAARVLITGRKLEQKEYFHHTGYPGGIRSTKLEDLMKTNPASVIERAVKGMLPKNKLQDPRLARLHVYAGEEHPHQAQKPVKLGENT